MSYELNDELRQKIHSEMGGFERTAIESEKLRDAAVAIVLVAEERTTQASFLLTRRPAKLRRHGGQYALPGGRIERGEDAQSAALREIEEEVGISLQQDAVLGWLDDFATRSGFRITPIVVWGGADCVLKPDPDEVEAVFRIPLWDLDREEIPALQEVEDSEHPVLSAPFDTLGHEVYAPTAAILYQFREVALRGRWTRVSHYEQPRFAWK